MVLETHGFAEKEMAKECTNIVLSRSKIKKQPDMKLEDLFSSMPKYAIFLFLITAFFVVMTILGKAGVLGYICLGLSAAATFVMVILWISMKKTYNNFMNNPEDVTVTIDESGVKLDDHKAQKIELTWSGIAFARFFEKNVAFFPTSDTGLAIIIPGEFAADIRAFLQSEKPDLKVIG